MVLLNCYFPSGLLVETNGSATKHTRTLTGVEVSFVVKILLSTCYINVHAHSLFTTSSVIRISFFSIPLPCGTDPTIISQPTLRAEINKFCK